LSSQRPAMAGDQLSLAINQDWNIEAKGLDTACDLSDLFLTVKPRILWIKPKRS
jgi:hypothetical protein